MAQKTGMNFISLACTMLFVAAALLCAIPAMPVQASTGQKAAWIRAKVEYEYDDGVTGLDDSILVFSNDKWTKDDDNWYYYSDRVFSGDRIRFIDAVKFPTSWTNDIINKRFKVIVTVEACEALRGEEGYAKNHPASYSQTYELWSAGYSEKESVDVTKTGKMTVKVNEYQLDDDGDEVPYKNGKVIVPGQKVSKIVEFELKLLSPVQELLAGQVPTGDAPVFLTAVAVAGIIAALVAIAFMRKKK